MNLFHLYRRPALSGTNKNELLSDVRKKVSIGIKEIETEYCFNIEVTAPLNDEELKVLRWLLSETFEPENFSGESFLTQHLAFSTQHLVTEVGPRMNFTTAWSTNAVSVCRACGLNKIKRIERSRRYKLLIDDEVQGTKEAKNQSLEPLNPRILEPFT